MARSGVNYRENNTIVSPFCVQQSVSWQSVDQSSSKSREVAMADDDHSALSKGVPRSFSRVNALRTCLLGVRQRRIRNSPRTHLSHLFAGRARIRGEPSLTSYV